MAVAALVLEHGGNEDQAIAGLIHDAVEDQGGLETLTEIRSMFGDDVAAIVSDCTDAWGEPKPPWRERKEAYLAALPKKPLRSQLVSLADKTHNAESILSDYRILGDHLWDRFNGGANGNRTDLWYINRTNHMLPTPAASRSTRGFGCFNITLRLAKPRGRYAALKD